MNTYWNIGFIPHLPPPSKKKLREREQEKNVASLMYHPNQYNHHLIVHKVLSRSGKSLCNNQTNLKFDLLIWQYYHSPGLLAWRVYKLWCWHVCLCFYSCPCIKRPVSDFKTTHWTLWWFYLNFTISKTVWLLVSLRPCAKTDWQ